MNQSVIFDYPVLIREKHLDTFGHVNNAVYLQLYEEARWDVITLRGYGMEKIRLSGLGPVLLEVNLKFLKEIHLRTEIVIKTQVIDYQNRIGILKQWMIDKEGAVYSEAEFKVALFDTKLRRMVDATPEWKYAIGIV